MMSQVELFQGPCRRDGGLDGLRGAAILLMVVDHLLATWQVSGPTPAWVQVLRLTTTRPALPCFMVVAGVLWERRGRPTSGRRLTHVGVAGLAVTAMMMALGLPAPDVLLVFALACLCGGVLLRRPVVLVTAGLLQSLYVAAPWTGYQPGYVLALVGIGVLAERAGAVPSLSRFDSGWLRAVGRSPLAWYVGHVALLFVVAGAWR